MTDQTPKFHHLVESYKSFSAKLHKLSKQGSEEVRSLKEEHSLLQTSQPDFHSLFRPRFPFRTSFRLENMHARNMHCHAIRIIHLFIVSSVMSLVEVQQDTKKFIALVLSTGRKNNCRSTFFLNAHFYSYCTYHLAVFAFS